MIMKETYINKDSFSTHPPYFLEIRLLSHLAKKFSQNPYRCNSAPKRASLGPSSIAYFAV